MEQYPKLEKIGEGTYGIVWVSMWSSLKGKLMIVCFSFIGIKQGILKLAIWWPLRKSDSRRKFFSI